MRYETKGKRNIDLGYNIPKNKTLQITDNNGETPQFMVLGGRKIHLTSGLPEYIDVEVVDNPSVEPSEAMMNVAKAFDLSGLGEELTSVIKKQQAIKQAFSEILFFKSEIDQKLAEYELLINGQVEDIRNEQAQNKVGTDSSILTLSNGQSVNTKDIQNIYGLIGGLSEKSLEIDSIISDIETILKNHEHGITKESLGLGKVDNTSDEDKPVSKATQEALDSKVSVDEFNEIAEQLKKIQKKQKDFQRGIDSLGGMGIGTVNLEGGKKGQVLVKKSNQNGDFEWRDSITQIDDKLSLTSEYPVQNKVITSSIIIKSNTIPTATQELVGTEYQYTGETNQTYTHGYIYECVEKTNYTPRISFDPSKIGFDYDKDLMGFFAEATPNYEQIKSGVFEYLEGGDIWSISAKDENGDEIFSEYKLYTDDLIDAGFVFLFPEYEDGEKIEYEFALNPSSSYEWERVDVQPNESVWGKVKGNLPDQEDLKDALDEKLNATQVNSAIEAKIIDSTSSTSTTSALSANKGKVLQDELDNVKARGRFLSVWNCTTGLPETNPEESPYPYKAGDYYIVGTVGTGTKYKPNGSSFTIGVASATVETSEVNKDDTYLYDGASWILQSNTQKSVTFSNLAGSPYDNTNLANALDSKVDDVKVNGTSVVTNKVASVTVPTQPSDIGAATAAQGTKADSALQGVQINGTDLTPDANNKVNIPVATNTTYGVSKVFSAYGITIISGTIAIQKPTYEVISQKVNSYQPIVPSVLDKAVMEGLGNNSLTWTEAYKTSARNTIGASQVSFVDWID